MQGTPKEIDTGPIQAPAAIPPIGQSGVDLIFRERLRQIREKGYDAAHDDQHTEAEILITARRIIDHVAQWPDPDAVTTDGTWMAELAMHLAEKYGDDLISRLAIAGALIAAEIDRLQRKAGAK